MLQAPLVSTNAALPSEGATLEHTFVVICGYYYMPNGDGSDV